MTNIAVGDVINSTVVVGNDNFVVHVDTVGAGATVNIVKPDSRPKYSPQPEPVLKLPRPFPALLGREKELSLLRNDIQASATVSLWARKGMGKTALARNITNSLPKEDPSKSVVYLDALGLGREDLLQALFDLFFDSAPSYVPSPASIPNALQKVKALVFVDNLGLAGDDVDSLVNAAPGCAFVLISTERALSGEGDALPLPGLPDADAVALFAREFGRALDDAEKEVCGKICALLKGCPDEIIKIAARGHAEQKSPAQLLAELSGSTVDEKSLATLAIANLSQADQQLLAPLAAAGGNAVPADILKILLQGKDISAELERLKSLNLVQSHSPRYSLWGTLDSGLAATWDLSGWRDALLETSLTWLSQQQPSETIEGALGMLLHVLADAAERKKWPEVIRLGRLLERFLIIYKRWQAWSDALNLVLQAAQATLDRATEGWALHQLGSRALFQGAFEPARSYLTQALKIREAIHDRAGIEVTRHNLDVLKAATAPSRGHGPGKSGPSGGHPLTYGLFAFAGLVLIAGAAYALGIRPPSPAPTKPVAPPIVSTTAAPITPSFTSSPTLTPTSSLTPTLTPTLTPSPTGTPTARVPFPAIVLPDYLACRYGPGAPYAYEWTLVAGNQVEVLGRQDTTAGTWVYVRFKGPNLPCWVNPDFLKMDGDIASLQQYYPDKAPLILYGNARFAAPPPPSIVDASRTGNVVQITVSGKDLAPGDRTCDRTSSGCLLFLGEFWTCQAGKFVFTPKSIFAEYDPKQPIVTGYTEIQDDAGCSEPSHGWIYLAHADGYVGPTYILPWP